MLNLLSKQPPEAPAQHEALLRLAKFKTRLEGTPDTRRGDWHEDVQIAYAGVLAVEGMVSRLIDLRSNTRGSDADEAVDDMIEALIEGMATVVSEAERYAEEDAPPYNSEDRWPRYRG